MPSVFVRNSETQIFSTFYIQQTYIPQLISISMYRFPCFLTPDSIQYFTVLPVTPPLLHSNVYPNQHPYNSNSFYLFTQEISALGVNQRSQSLPNDRCNYISNYRFRQRSQIDANSGSEQMQPINSQVMEGQLAKSNLKKDKNYLKKYLQNPIQLTRRQADSKISEDIQKDHLYDPLLQKKKKKPQKYRQNESRNITPNQISQIFSFIQRKNKSGRIVSKLFQKFPHPPQFTTKRFYLYQSLLKNKLNHYTNLQSLKLVKELYEPKCENWREPQQRYYNKICRLLIHHFLREDSIVIILTSKRMNQENKAAHIRARRQVAQQVLGLLRGH